MKNSYIICEVYKRDSFICSLSINIHKCNSNVLAKIDTGCEKSVIPFKKLNSVTDDISLRYKQQDISNKVPFSRGYGVSDTEEIKLRDKKLVQGNDLINCTSLNFKHTNIEMMLNGYKFSHDIRVNYDRTGNILIGMDILKEFDYHCGISKLTGKHTFIGVLDSQEDKLDYYRALKEHFGIIREHSFWAKLFKERYNK